MATIKEMLKQENVQIIKTCKNWESAIRISVQPLVNGGYVTPAYINGIIENAHKFGPYFVLAPDLALLHARPEQGVLHQQLAVTVCREGVKFKEDADPVRVLVTLAAETPDDHIYVMRAFATMFADPSNIEKIATANSPANIYQLFISFDSQD